MTIPIGIGLTIAGLIVLLVGRLRGRDAIAGGAKVVASIGFLTVGVGAGALDGSTYNGLIAAGLVAGFFGDVFLIPKDARGPFLAGLVSFLLGHLLYLGAFVAADPDTATTSAAVVVCGVFGALFFRYLGIDKSNSMRPAVALYIAAISACTGAGIGLTGHPNYWLIAPGIVLFFISDIGVALDRFKPAAVPAYLWSLPAYYSGQVCLALSCTDLQT